MATNTFVEEVTFNQASESFKIWYGFRSQWLQ